MYKYAYIEQSRVRGIYEYDMTPEQLKEMFDPLSIFIPIDDIKPEPRIGWYYNGETFESVTPDTFEYIKKAKYIELDNNIKKAITSGFVSKVKGESYVYDSDENDQSNLQTMYIASRSEEFLTHPVYKGQIPIRAYLQTDKDKVKVVLMHNRDELQVLMDDLALHIGAVKQEGWVKQQKIAEATTIEELNAIFPEEL